jgi:hypothetical protein
MAVVIVIEETCRDMPTVASDTCFCGDICEGTISIIVIQDILSVTCDEQVGIAIVVLVADRHAHAVVSDPSGSKSGGFGDIAETAIFVLAIQAVQ